VPTVIKRSTPAACASATIAATDAAVGDSSSSQPRWQWLSIQRTLRTVATGRTRTGTSTGTWWGLRALSSVFGLPTSTGWECVRANTGGTPTTARRVTNDPRPPRRPNSGGAGYPGDSRRDRRYNLPQEPLQPLADDTYGEDADYDEDAGYDQPDYGRAPRQPDPEPPAPPASGGYLSQDYRSAQPPQPPRPTTQFSTAAPAPRDQRFPSAPRRQEPGSLDPGYLDPEPDAAGYEPRGEFDSSQYLSPTRGDYDTGYETPQTRRPPPVQPFEPRYDRRPEPQGDYDAPSGYERQPGYEPHPDEPQPEYRSDY
jgi:hypothetical protein